MSELEQRLALTIERERRTLGLRPEHLCVAAGLSRASYYNRITSGGWRLIELEGIAPVLNKTVVTLVSESAWTRPRLVAA